MKHKIIYLPMVVLIRLLSGCSGDTTANTDETVADTKFCLSEQMKKTTTISTLELLPITEQLSLSGKIDYNENDLVAFRSLLEGTVESVGFELGDYVKAGQLLATIKSTHVQELFQEHRNYQNQIVMATKQLQTKKELLQDGMVAGTEVLTSEHELASLKIERDRVQQILKMYRAKGQGSFEIVAPKNGYIIQKAVSIGQSISADQDPLFSISNLKQVWVMVNIYANNLKYIKEGDAVKVKTIAQPDTFYPGKIDKIYHVFDDNEHVLKARVILENQNLQLMPGLAADIIIDKSNAGAEAYAIPNAAIVFHNNKEYIVVYKDDCAISTKRITTLTSNEQYTFVQEKFAADEQVISKNALLLFEQLNP
ncbi:MULTISPECIES: efflux RND transporter periplasmic adaptor subunit [Sphingobacterium]|uniref:efflux RND transporter periplasmic adaptor subunit n=2 Tax=Sphingobacteriaceae TaxID=84566 RepID=UPI00130DBB43|nr:MULTISPECIES: efflux RND transporter periplasmic adaptor subunit [Sphingobacterium]MDH5827449.1 efflux RND transporter periplasmic adaptor subunit [Sphingobacterium faecium]